MRHLLEMARELGITLEYADLTHLGHDGHFDPERSVIRLQRGLVERIERSTLAHELAHVIFGDRPTRARSTHWKQERRADEWAARTLIKLEDYKTAEAIRNGHTPAMAHDLHVSLDLVEAYQRILLRIGDTVYLKPGLGAGDWLHKEQVA